jgi:hypothetical protein
MVLDFTFFISITSLKKWYKSDITLFREYRSEFDPQQRFKGDKAYIGEDLRFFLTYYAK